MRYDRAGCDPPRLVGKVPVDLATLASACAAYTDPVATRSNDFRRIVADLPQRTLLEQLYVVLGAPLEDAVPMPETHLERTIHEAVEFNGIGLHSGAAVSMRLVPAPAGSGIVFRRTDLDGFEIPANGRNVARVSYATSLMRGSVLISTTEHLLSALIGCGVDNVIIEVDNLEIPILDGSALPYVLAFEQVGLKQQRRKREYLRVLKAVEVSEGTKFIGLYPGDGYTIDYRIDFPQPIGSASLSVDLQRGDYPALIAPARTFGFREDEAMLRNMGLIRGVSDDCAIIVSAQGIQNGPLRFSDEFVRHKVLDLIGDLALAGRRIQGRVVAERAGHAMHTALVQRLLRDRSAWEMAHGVDRTQAA